MEKEKNLITPSTLASRWKMTCGTLSQWRWNGYGPPYHKMGKKILYDLEEIEQFEAKKVRQNTSEKEKK
ncbi:MAG TPA: DNA-binding protein [Alphaproteobacteria bacterium]|nr:DNA-binding protein [Alphaproteobacteria bacterium]